MVFIIIEITIAFFLVTSAETEQWT